MSFLAPFISERTKIPYTVSVENSADEDHDPFVTEDFTATSVPNIVLVENSIKKEYERLEDFEASLTEDSVAASRPTSPDSDSVPVRNIQSSPVIGRKQNRPRISAILSNYFQEKGDRPVRQKDHLTKFFEAMEETVRTFKPQLQVEVKMKISAMVLHYELQNLRDETIPP